MSWTSALPKSAVPRTARTPIAAVAKATFPPPIVDWKKLVTLDFETYYDQDYTLKKLTTSEYIRDPRFEAQMCGIKIGEGKTKVYHGKDIAKALAAIDWTTHSVLAHHTQFDGLILSHHYGVIPKFYYCTLSMARGWLANDIGAGLDEVSRFFGGGGKVENGAALVGMRGIHLKDMHPEVFRKGAEYCAGDVDECYRIFRNELLQHFPQSELTLIDATCQMFCCPVLRLDEPRARAAMEKEIADREALLLSVCDQDVTPAKLSNEALRDLTGAPTALGSMAEKKLYYDALRAKVTDRQAMLYTGIKLIGSNEQFADLLRNEGVEPPVKVSMAWIKTAPELRTDANKYAYAFAKDDLPFQELLNEHESQRVRDLCETRLAVKSNINITRAGRLLESGKNGRAMPVYYKYAGAHCVPAGTEVLTREGWKKIEEWSGGEIAQYHPSGEVEFLPAVQYIGAEEEAWVRSTARYMPCDFTPGHKIPVLKQKTFKFGVKQAADLLNIHSERVPLAGRLAQQGSITPEQMRVLAMVQADGSYELNTKRGRKMTVFVKKPRKIARAHQLLNAAGIAYRTNSFPSHPGFVRFTVNVKDWPEWLTPERKFYGAWLLDSTSDAREAFIEELQHWDGWLDKGCINYSSSVRSNAEWVVTLCHLTGRSATCAAKDRDYGRVTNFSVHIRNRAYGMVFNKHISPVRQRRMTYCASTQTGFWLARSNGHIFVTGNTWRFSGGDGQNWQNFTRGGELRLSIQAPAGYALVVVDSGQIEARVNAWLWGQEDLLEAFRRGEDIYSLFATENIYGRLITKKDISERHVGKTAILGLGFQMGGPKFRNTLARGVGGPAVFIDDATAKSIVNAYRRRYYKIKQGWGICEQIIEDMATGRTGTYKCISWEHETIWLPNGMRLKYPNLRKDAEGNWCFDRKGNTTKLYGGLLCENIVQALARIIVAAEQLLKISERYPVVMTTHDEVVTCVPLNRYDPPQFALKSVAALATLDKRGSASEAMAYMHKVMTTPPNWCADIPLSAEGGFDLLYSK